MIIINKPPESWKEILLDVKCYRCGREMKVSPMTNMNAHWLIDCELHKKENSADE